MKKLTILLIALAMLVNLASMGIGCKAKVPEKPVVKEQAKPAQAPAPDEDDD